MKLESKIKRFRESYPDEESCLQLLSEHKWSDGFICSKCGNTNYCKGKTAYSRRCTRCKKEESVTARTIFHRCKIPLNKAFEIAFTICHAPDISSYKISRQLDMRHMTCYSFQKKMLNCRDGENTDPLLEFVLDKLNRSVKKRVN
jgi:hypothetical protein